jgi:hypothetical protein
MTALYDAIGIASKETGAALAAMNEADRPDVVSIVIFTDGEENVSKEYTRQMITDIIEHQRDVYSWDYTFLAKDLTAASGISQLNINANRGFVGSVGQAVNAYSVNTSHARTKGLSAVAYSKTALVDDTPTS